MQRIAGRVDGSWFRGDRGGEGTLWTKVGIARIVPGFINLNHTRCGSQCSMFYHVTERSLCGRRRGIGVVMTNGYENALRMVTVQVSRDGWVLTGSLLTVFNVALFERNIED